MKTILFDLDGTLIDSRKDLANAVNASLAAIGHDQKMEQEIVRHIGDGLTILLKKNLGSVTDTQLEKAHEVFSEFYGKHCVDFTQLYPGVLGTLKELSTEAKIGVVTNKPFRFARSILVKLKVMPLVKVLIGGDTTPEKKPHPEPVLEALRQLKSEKSSSYFVGDGPQDIEAGKRANIKTGAVTYGFGFNQEVLDFRPDFVFKNFDQVKEIMK